jgi:hypothetical protein
MTRRLLPLLEDSSAREVVKNVCADHLIDLRLLEDLIGIQRDNLGRGRQMGITQEFSAAISDFLERQGEDNESD